MKDIELINIDRSALDPNYKESERIVLSEIDFPYVIPDKGPMYSKSIRIIAGPDELKEGTDYFIREVDTELGNELGHEVCLFVAITRRVLNDYKELRLTYQRVGDPVFGLKDLLVLLDNSLNSKKRVDWITEVHEKPSEYWASKHQHDIKSASEVIGFGGLIHLILVAKSNLEDNGLKLFNRLEQIKSLFYEELNTTYNELWDNLFNHVRDYAAPHQPEKGDVGLGNHPNYATATKEEDMLGVRHDLLSTPLGLKFAIEFAQPNTDSYILQNTTPFSNYGSTIYIPPAIQGSFEGLGANQETSAICKESNGWVVALLPGFDLKVKNLYFYYNTDIKKKGGWVNSNHIYEHPFIKSKGCVANGVIGGSGADVIMVGDVDKQKWFISLGNGSLNPAGHNFRLIDFSNIDHLIAPGTKTYTGNKTVHLFGDWIYFIDSNNSYPVDTPRTSGNAIQRFFRLHKSVFGDNTKETVQFEIVKLNYDNLDRERKLNQDYFQMTNIKYDSNGLITQGFSKYSPSITYHETGRRRQFVTMANPDNPNDVTFWIGQRNYVQLVNDDVSIGHTVTYWIKYRFDVTTNTLVLDPKYQMPTYDIVNDKLNIPNGLTYDDYGNRLDASTFTQNYDRQSAIYIPGYGLYTIGYYLKLPYVTCGLELLPNSDKTDWEKFNTSFKDLGLALTDGPFYDTIEIKSPFNVTGVFCGFADIYEYNGKVQTDPLEFFISDNSTGGRECNFRLTSGTQFKSDPSYQLQFLPQYDINARTPNINYGKVDNIRRCPLVYYNEKSEHSKQYGIIRFNSLRLGADGKPILNTNINGSAFKFDENDGVVLPLLGVNSYDRLNSKLSISSTKERSVYIKKSVWETFVKTAIGGDWNDIIEYNFSMYVSSKPGNQRVPKSICYVAWHTKSDYKRMKMCAFIFNWAYDTDFNGYKTIKTTDIETPFVTSGGVACKPGTTGWVDNDVYYDTNHKWVVLGDLQTNGLDLVQINNVQNNSNPNDQDFFAIVNPIIRTIGNSLSYSLRYTKINNVVSVALLERGDFGTGQAVRSHKYVVDGVGICQALGGEITGGAGLYVKNPANNKLYNLASTFISGNWGVIIPAPVPAAFNGVDRIVPEETINLQSLGIDPKNKTFYLYAVSTPSSARYELSLKARTANPYTLLAAIIKTNSNGITSIDVKRPFAISGFVTSTVRTGGSILTSSGTPNEVGGFKVLKYSDLYLE